MSAPFKLSVLDQSPIPEGAAAGEALRNSVDLARLADRLGYHRYWVAEHHGTPGLACAGPEVLMAAVAAATTHLRVGSGGVMLPHYSPLKVAENFGMLAGLHPGRIDLAVGRAAGTDAATTLALQRDRRRSMPDDYPAQLTELLGYVESPRPGPAWRDQPDVWLLGSSPQSAVWATQLGLPYAFADFINPYGADIARLYREQFTAGRRRAAPHVAVAAWVVCADTAAEANDLAASFKMLLTLLHRGRLIAVPPVETALRFLRENAGPAGDMPANRRALVGPPEVVKAAVETLAAEYGADEVFLINIVHDHTARKRSYQLVAEAFGLVPPHIGSGRDIFPAPVLAAGGVGG